MTLGEFIMYVEDNDIDYSTPLVIMWSHPMTDHPTIDTVIDFYTQDGRMVIEG